MPTIKEPFIADPKNIANMVSKKTYRVGLHYFNNNCVLECDVYPDQVIGSVEAEDSELPWLVKIELEQQSGEPIYSRCYCEQIEEPLCSHAVATLLQCHEQYQEDKEQLSAQQLKETALLDRVKKGQKEVNVTPVQVQHGYGDWEASSITSATHRDTSYRVQIRSFTEKQNLCSCPDWRNNQLGTCKHIEAVLHDIKRNNADALPQPLPFSFVYRGWDDREAILKVQRAQNLDDHLNTTINRYFDAAGRFTGQLPEDFYTLRDAVFDNPQFLIGDDAVTHVQKLQAKQNHALRKREIQEHIELNGDRISGVNAKLFPYQVEGVAFLASNGRALLADDMGLGKSLQSITAAWWLHRHAHVEKVLIICPASLKSQWAREIEKFLGIDSQIIQGNAQKRLQQYRNDKLFVILNYETVISDLEYINGMLAPDLIILDEAQRLKNWRTKIASSIKLVPSKYTFVLTGTPLENKLEDLYSVMQIVDPGLLGPLWRFMADFHLTDDKGKVLAYRNISELRRLIAPVMLRRNRSIVSNQLPSMSKRRIDTGMTNIQRDHHDAAMSAAAKYADIARKRPLTPSENNRLMAALQQARMACNAAGLVDKESKGSPKLEELRQLLTELCLDLGQKVVVFSQWRLMTEMIEELVKDMKLGFVHLHGGVPSAKRGDLMKAFHEDDSIAVFIATDAGSTGLNLQCATTLINIDVPWNPAILEQRNARIHRLGQTENVRIISLISANSYEERVLGLVNSKQDLFDSTISGDSDQDIVTVGGKALSSLIGDLQSNEEVPDDAVAVEDAPGAQESDAPEDEAPEYQSPENETPELKKPAPVWLPKELEDDSELEQIILQVETQFSGRIESIKARKDQIIVVLLHITDEDEDFTESLDSHIPVALVDTRSLRQLQKLAPEGWSAITTPTEAPQKPVENPWHKTATDKLQTAKLLQQQGLSGVMDLLSAAICAKITAILEQQEQCPQDQACLALYTDTALLEKLSASDIATFNTVFNLSKLNTDIPAALQEALIVELEGILVG